MIKTKRHIINKFFLEVNTTSKEQAYAIKDNLNQFLKEEVFPELEAYFGNIEKTMHASGIRIEKLNIDLNLKEGFKYSELKEKIVAEVGKTILEKIDGEITTGVSGEGIDQSDGLFLGVTNTLVKSFFFFLEKGTLPWWDTTTDATFLSDSTVLQEVISTSEFPRIFHEKIKVATLQKRLIKQFSDEAIKEILLGTNQTYQDQTNIISQILNDELLVLFENMNSSQRVELWTSILSFFQTKDNTKFHSALQVYQKAPGKELGAQYSLWLEKTIAMLDTYPRTTKTSDQDTSESVEKDNVIEVSIGEVEERLDLHKKEDFDTAKEVQEELLQDEILPKEEDSYYINNAGLILIHPFINHFFEHCELIEENTIRDKELAVHLLHYVATKKEQQPEYLMIFEKFLCNIPIHQPITRKYSLTKKQKDQANDLMAAVLQNWEAIRDSSNDLLRNEFLQRPGKLILSDKNPKLIIERKTQDILLDRLPWNMSVVKLPWKEKLIFVDW